MKKFYYLIIFAITLFFPISAYASTTGTITVVNPIRGPQLGLETANLPESLKSQWQQTKEASVTATWLWQYSALENQNLINLAKAEMQNQEHGIFLEIDKNTADKSGVGYKGKSAWYHSDGLLLVSYDPSERRKLIDTIFNKFHQVFGYYPKSVGAWWVGADAIKYMKDKYAITGVLQCADQYNTDAYSIWGTPWSIPYISAFDNAAIPAQPNNNAGVVMMQWAPRDPLHGYGESVVQSTFSAQDYELKGYDLRYFNYLKNIYTQTAGDQFVIGLESGLPPESYQGQYGKQLKNLDLSNIQTMQQFAKQFLSTGKILPPTNYFLTSDYENSDQSFTYNSSAYRVLIHKLGNDVLLVDLRDYTQTPAEDFNQIPNTQPILRINTSSLVDSVRFPDQIKKLTTSSQQLTVNYTPNEVTLLAGDEIIGKFSNNQASIKNSLYSFTKKEVPASLKFLEAKSIYLLKLQKLNESAVSQYEQILHSKKALLKFLLSIYVIIGIIITIVLLYRQKNRKLSLSLIFITLLALGIYSYPFITSPESSILTTYEAESLQFAINTGKDIAYLEPLYDKNYPSLKPYIYSKPVLAEQLTNKQWKYLKRVKGKPLQTENRIIIVPRYTGQELYAEEIESLNLVKVFDNAQIEIYQKK